MPPNNTAYTSDELFEIFVNAQTFKTILHSFDELCRSLRIDRTTIGYGRRSLYKILTSKLTSWKSKSLWAKIDKRGAQKEYENGNVCADTKVCIVGAGPVGLRLSIECALLGARCVVVEKRDRFSRHNVLHLWPYVITDLKNLGAKFFYGKFATGQIEHISIRQLQCILLKIALLLGVEIYPNVTFESVLEPTSNTQEWRANFEPRTHPIVSTFDFNVLIGADGRRNSLQGFQRKEFRGKLAIGITCNFVNHHTREEQHFEEISGVAKIYNPQFFYELKQQTSIDLENIVYYKNETHYFVMTAKKHSLLDKRVILQDYPDAARLLARDNVDFTQLCNFACEAAQFATKAASQTVFEFAINHYGTSDVQMFDFTSLFHAVNASRIVERNGKRLFMGLVGDSLLESFWPTGSGAGLGFLGLFDTAWSILKFAKREHPLKILVERESVYMLLSQSTPENTKTNHQLYTINPLTRYQNLNSKSCTIDEIRYLFDSDTIPTVDINNNHLSINNNRIPIRRAQSFKHVSYPLPPSADNHNHSDNNGQENSLIQWCEELIDSYALEVKKDSKAFQNGLAFCAIVHHYRPDLIDFKSLQPERPVSNFQILFDIMHDQLSLPLDRKLQNSLLLSMKSSIEERIRQSAIVLLQLLYTHFHRDHHEQYSQQRRSSTPLLEFSAPIKQPLSTESNSSTMKVSALVAHYSGSDSSGNNHALIGLQSERTPTFCFYCKDKVSIQDWFVVEKNVLHVKCFKCDTCHLPLRKTNYQIYIEPTTGKTSFHCRYHNLNRQEQQQEEEKFTNNHNQFRLGIDQSKRALSFDETDLVKKRTISSEQSSVCLSNAATSKQCPANERVSFSLEKALDQDKDEVVYSCASDIVNDDEEEGSVAINGSSTTSSEEETSDDDNEEDEEEEEQSDNQENSLPLADKGEEEEEENDEDDNDSVLKSDASKSDSQPLSTAMTRTTSTNMATNGKKSLFGRRPFLSIDSGHIQSESPSPIDLSPSTSPLNRPLAKSEPITYSYFRAPCPRCSGSTYDDISTVEIAKQFYHKTCLRCYSCDKQLKENEFIYHDQTSDGVRHFYCTLHFCKSRLKQVTSTLAAATQQDSRIYPTLSHQRVNPTGSNTGTLWNSSVRLYPSLKDALSPKPHPLNVVNIPDEEQQRRDIGFAAINESVLHGLRHPMIRSRTFDEATLISTIHNDENSNGNVKQNLSTNETSKQRFKRRGRNRPASPLPPTASSIEIPIEPIVRIESIRWNNVSSLLNVPSTINRKKKKILISPVATRSSSSSTSSHDHPNSPRQNPMDDERQRMNDERRQYRELRQKESMRLRRSQEIQRELNEIEERRLELDSRHASARQSLDACANDDSKKVHWEQECLRIVNERASLQRCEDLYQMAKSSLTLENERARAENEYRQLISLPIEQKTTKDERREAELLVHITKLVDDRNRLTTNLEQNRLREMEEDECLRQAYRLHGIDHHVATFHPLDILKDII